MVLVVHAVINREYLGSSLGHRHTPASCGDRVRVSPNLLVRAPPPVDRVSPERRRLHHRETAVVGRRLEASDLGYRIFLIRSTQSPRPVLPDRSFAYASAALRARAMVVEDR